MMTLRPSIDLTLMMIAQVWESRSTCSRNHVGAVIAREGRHIGSGYNGAPAGMPHCQHGLPLERTRPIILPESMSPGCSVVIHAEANAISYSARNGVATDGATIYTTLSPCRPCSQLIITAGLIRVVYNREYRDTSGLDLLISAGVTVDQLGL